MAIHYQEYDQDKIIKLDNKDKQILKILNTDCRMSLSDISRKTQIPIDTVKYRIERMEKEKVYHYAIVMDPAKIGYPIYDALYINLINFTEEKEKELSEYAEKHKNLVYSAKTMGKYDFIIGVVARNARELNQIIQEFKTKFQDIIKEFDSLSMITEYKYDYYADLIGE